MSYRYHCLTILKLFGNYHKTLLKDDIDLIEALHLPGYLT